MTQTLTQPPVHEHTHCEHSDHEHHTAEQTPVISERWKWLTVAGNAAIGSCELATGNLSTLAVTAGGLHDVADSATYYMQAENVLNPSLSEERRTKLRKAAHWIIAATSLAVGIKAGTDLALDHESAPNAAAVYAAGASLALNGLLLARLRAGIRRKRAGAEGTHISVHEEDLSKHFWAIDMPSAGLALAGAALQRYNVDIEQLAAVANGLVGAYAFRPTRANLAHGHCLDGHGHHAHEDEHTGAPHKSWLQRIQHKPRREAGVSADPPPAHSWTYHPRNYKRDVLRRIQQNGERPGIMASAWAIGQLLLRPRYAWQRNDPTPRQPATISDNPPAPQTGAAAETAQSYDGGWETVKTKILEDWKAVHAQAERDFADMRARYDAATAILYPTD